MGTASRKGAIPYLTRAFFEELRDNGVPGIHFYVLNRSYSVSNILDNLNLPGHNGRD